MRFNKSKSRVLHTCRGNPRYQYGLEDEEIESIPAKTDVGILVHEKLDVSRPCELTGLKANHILSCTKRSVASRSRKGIVLLHSALVTPHPEACISEALRSGKTWTCWSRSRGGPQKRSEG